MNLKKKKKLIARVLKVGLGRIKLNSEMEGEIKEAITRQDIKDLKKEKIVGVKEKRGKMKKLCERRKRKQGSRKKNMRKRKQGYVKLTRKLRGYIKKLKEESRLSREQYYDLRKKIRAREFRDLRHLIQTTKERQK